MAKKCTCCKCTDTGFQAPAKAVDFLRAHAGDKPTFVAIAWERENGHIYRYDLAIPRRIDSACLPGVRHLAERIVKFVLWAAGGWKLYLAGPDEIVKPIAKDYSKKANNKAICCCVSHTDSSAILTSR